MATDSWSSIPWDLETSGDASTFHKSKIPYKTNANALQNLDIWIPATKSQELPDSSSLPTRDGLWIIYIHGGAWRDPLVLSDSFTPTVKALTAAHSSMFPNIAGIASLNYSLTPRGIDERENLDISRQAKHPDHIVDVLTALSYLQLKAGFGSNYVLLGHSCGATLAFQVAMAHSKWGSAASALKVAKPKAIVGLNGLYDMPTLIREPGEEHAKLQAAYEEFTRLAFGDDEKVWAAISPISVSDWKEEWVEGTKVVFVQSKEDSLVPYWQTADLMKAVLGAKGEGLEVEEMEAGGDHNELWEKGDRLAEIVAEVVNSMS